LPRVEILAHVVHQQVPADDAKFCADCVYEIE